MKSQHELLTSLQREEALAYFIAISGEKMLESVPKIIDGKLVVDIFAVDV